MQVIEAQRASILEPHDHLHINQMSAFAVRRFLHRLDAIAGWIYAGRSDLGT
jgi:hypothetical protein